MRQRAWFECRWAARGWWMCVVLLAGVMIWTQTGMPATARAQDEAKEPAKEDAKKEAPANAENLIDDAAPAKAAPAPAAAPAAAPAPANESPPADVDQPTRPPEMSLLSEALTALGSTPSAS
jgi:zona occludens toxin (predicted ATPase)